MLCKCQVFCLFHLLVLSLLAFSNVYSASLSNSNGPLNYLDEDSLVSLCYHAQMFTASIDLEKSYEKKLNESPHVEKLKQFKMDLDWNELIKKIQRGYNAKNLAPMPLSLDNQASFVFFSQLLLLPNGNNKPRYLAYSPFLLQEPIHKKDRQLYGGRYPKIVLNDELYNFATGVQRVLESRGVSNRLPILKILTQHHLRNDFLNSYCSDGLRNEINVFNIVNKIEYKRMLKGSNLLSPDIDKISSFIAQETGVQFNSNDFKLIESVEFANNFFQSYAQVVGGFPIHGTSLRVYMNKARTKAELIDIHVDMDHKLKENLLERFASNSTKMFKSDDYLNNLLTNKIVQISGNSNSDILSSILSRDYVDSWYDGDLVRDFKVKTKSGFYYVMISLKDGLVLRSSYHSHLKADPVASLRANVFPIYEEVEGTKEILKTEEKLIKYLNADVYDNLTDPLDLFTQKDYSQYKRNKFKAALENGAGEYWSEKLIEEQVHNYVESFVGRTNSFDEGVLLQGQYATVQIHPDAIKFKTSDTELFAFKKSINYVLVHEPTSGFFKVKSGYYGKPICSQEELLSRIPKRLPDHNVREYLAQGFDEIQVYYAITTMMEDLKELGFTDKNMSSKPFNVFLYDPNIDIANNAYYHNNSIYFTTYPAGEKNLARDNLTIWHELGHGIMDRIMGDLLVFEDTGTSYSGLSEGLAEFLAVAIAEMETKGNDFPGKSKLRFINSLGLGLSNEAHDSGFAYVGALYDMLLAAKIAYPIDGLHDFTSLVLQTMRLARNHPALNSKIWFNLMLHADESNSKSGKFKKIILSKLRLRNIDVTDTSLQPSSMLVLIDEEDELTQNSKGSRERPLSLSFYDDEFVDINLDISLTSGDLKFLTFPATIKISFNGEGLQGAARWVTSKGSENDLVYVIKSKIEVLRIPIRVNSWYCDFVNKKDGGCVDYATIQVWSETLNKPIAKKRFYVKI